MKWLSDSKCLMIYTLNLINAFANKTIAKVIADFTFKYLNVLSQGDSKDSKQEVAIRLLYIYIFKCYTYNVK